MGKKRGKRVQGSDKVENPPYRSYVRSIIGVLQRWHGAASRVVASFGPKAAVWLHQVEKAESLNGNDNRSDHLLFLTQKIVCKVATRQYSCGDQEYMQAAFLK